MTRARLLDLALFAAACLVTAAFVALAWLSASRWTAQGAS